MFRGATLVVPLFYCTLSIILLNSCSDLAAVQMDDKWGYIDKTGKIRIKPQYAEVRKFSEGLAAVRNSAGKWGFIATPIQASETVSDHDKVNVPTNVTATPTTSKVIVDGNDIAFQAYTINGNNYFKLRDLAMVLNHTSKSFSVGWDGEKNAISMRSGESYEPVGGELMVADQSATQEAKLSTSIIYLDGKEVNLTAYTIKENNYFKLRDVAAVIDFGVLWDGAANTIKIDSSIGYDENQ